MKKILAFCLLGLLPLVAHAGYIFEIKNPTDSGIFIDNFLEITKESIKYNIREDIKDASGKVIDRKYWPKIVNHSQVDAEILKELSDNYGATVRVSDSGEYGIGPLNVDDLFIVTDKSIIIANIDIRVSGNIYLRSNSLISVIATDMFAEGIISFDNKEADKSSMSSYIFGSNINAVGDISIKAKNDVGLYGLRHLPSKQAKDSGKDKKQDKPVGETEL